MKIKSRKFCVVWIWKRSPKIKLKKNFYCDSKMEIFFSKSCDSNNWIENLRIRHLRWWRRLVVIKVMSWMETPGIFRSNACFSYWIQIFLDRWRYFLCQNLSFVDFKENSIKSGELGENDYEFWVSIPWVLHLVSEFPDSIFYQFFQIKATLLFFKSMENPKQGVF